MLFKKLAYIALLTLISSLAFAGHSHFRMMIKNQSVDKVLVIIGGTYSNGDGWLKNPNDSRGKKVKPNQSITFGFRKHYDRYAHHYGSFNISFTIIPKDGTLSTCTAQIEAHWRHLKYLRINKSFTPKNCATLVKHSCLPKGDYNQKLSCTVSVK